MVQTKMFDHSLCDAFLVDELFLQQKVIQIMKSFGTS